jgi:hypothetical protein
VPITARGDVSILRTHSGGKRTRADVYRGVSATAASTLYATTDIQRQQPPQPNGTHLLSSGEPYAPGPGVVETPWLKRPPAPNLVTGLRGCTLVAICPRPFTLSSYCRQGSMGQREGERQGVGKQ